MTFSKEDAEDILDFTHAILEYCLKFKWKFEQLLNRKEGKTKRQIQRETETKALVDLLHDSSSNDFIRFYAAICLTRLEDDQVIPTLINFLEQERHVQATMSCLEQFEEKSIQELTRLLADPTKNKKARVNAAKTIGRIGEKAEVSIPQLLNLLADSNLNQEIGVEIVHALDRIGLKAKEAFVDQYSCQS